MKQFTFLAKPEIICGENAVQTLPQQITRYNGHKALLVLDAFFARTDACREITGRLETARLPFAVYDKIQGEPATEIGDECAALGKSSGCDIVVGIGGGSTLDTAKAAAVLITNGGTVRDYQGLNKVPGPGLPSIMVPTTAGTGSEVTFTAVFIRKDEKKKGGINSPFLFPAAAILDPTLTLSVPPAVTASTGLDALCHALESYVSKKATFMSEVVSAEAIRLIWSNLPIAFANGSDYRAREKMLYGSFLAGLGLANAGVTAVHSISYPLGGSFGVPHGVANGLLLPYVLEYDLPEIADKIGGLACCLDRSWASESNTEAASAFIEGLKFLLGRFAIPRLADLKIPPDAFPALAADAMKVSVPIENNPKPITEKDIVEIYRRAL